MTWYNVNEDGEVYGEHENQADAEALQRQFPSDTVVEASSREEAERLAWQRPDAEPDFVPEDEQEEQLSVPEIVRSSPTMSAIRVELYDTAENWLHTSVDKDSEVNFDHAALVAYQAMTMYPPQTKAELMAWYLSIFPDARFGEGEDGEIVIYTGKKEGE